MAHHFHVYVNEHWAIVAVAGGALCAHAGLMLFLHRRWRELAVKYAWLNAEIDALRRENLSLRAALTAVEARVDCCISTADGMPFNSPPSASMEADTAQPLSCSTMTAVNSAPTGPGTFDAGMPYNSSTESIYVDAVEELYSSSNTALNVINTSVVSASELLAPERPKTADKGSSSSAMSQATGKFDTIDRLHEEGDSKKAFDECKRLFDADPNNQKDAELLWRYSRACYNFQTTIGNDEAKKKLLLQDGQKLAEDALKIDDKNFYAVKFAAINAGSLTDHLGTKEKIQLGYIFKGYLDKALAMKPAEHTLLHMRGRFAYSVANLSWLERKAAAAFYADPPKATFDEAIVDFLEVEKITPGTWIENLLYLAKCYLAKGDKKSALNYLNQLITLTPVDEAEKEAINEAQALIAKHSK